MSNKHCVDCRHFLWAMHPPHHFCKLAVRDADVVTGSVDFVSARAARSEHAVCGPSATQFSPKPDGLWKRMFG